MQKQYVYIKELDEHLKKEHGIRRYKCTDCGKGFENLGELIEHEKNCFTCNLCDYGRTMSRKDFEDHIDWRHDKNCYICEQCSKWYESRKDLEDHRRRTYSKECEEKLVCRNEREQQKREEHRNGLVCDLCDEKFKNESELEEH